MVTVTQAATIIGVSGARVRQLIAEGKLKAKPINSRLYLLEVKDVKRFAAKPRKGPGRPKKILAKSTCKGLRQR